MCGFLWIFRIFFCHLPEDRQLGGQSADRRTSIRLCKYFGGVWPRKLTSSAAPGASGDLQPSRFPWERTQSIREPPQYSVPRAGNSRAKHRLRTPRYIIYVCIEKNLKRPCRPRPATNVIIDTKRLMKSLVVEHKMCHCATTRPSKRHRAVVVIDRLFL